MQVNFSQDDLRPLVATVVAECFAQLRDDEARIGERLALSEIEAARLIGVESHVLRDARLRGEISASRIAGRRIRYLPADVLTYLARNRTESRT
jgi:hypothetical protein